MTPEQSPNVLSEAAPETRDQYLANGQHRTHLRPRTLCPVVAGLLRNWHSPYKQGSELKNAKKGVLVLDEISNMGYFL